MQVYLINFVGLFFKVHVIKLIISDNCVNTDLHDNDDDDDDDDDDAHDDCCLRVEARAKGGEKTKTGNVWLDLNIILFII